MDYTTLTVMGASGRIGREVARLGIAYGANVYGVTRRGPPDLDEPWVVGVEWLDAQDWLEHVDSGALVVAAPVDHERLLGRVEGFDRVVLVVSATEAQRLDTAPVGPARVVVATPDAVDDSRDPAAHVAHAGPIPVEQLGMALLRAALDEGIPPKLDHGSLLRLGDSVMLQ